MALLQAHINTLMEKLGNFTPDEGAVLRHIVQHQERRRSELNDEFDDLKLVDSATNKGAKLGLLEHDTAKFSFKPNPLWKEYLEDALLKIPPPVPSRKRKVAETVQ
jgi:hypothetical protein